MHFGNVLEVVQNAAFQLVIDTPVDCWEFFQPAAQQSFDGSEKTEQTQYAEADSMESPVQELTPLPEQQAALAVEQLDSLNLTR